MSRSISTERFSLLLGFTVALLLSCPARVAAEQHLPPDLAKQKGSVVGVLRSTKTGQPVPGQRLVILATFDKSDTGRPLDGVLTTLVTDSPAITTDASGKFEFKNVSVWLQKFDPAKYTLSSGSERNLLKDSRGQLVTFQLKEGGVTDIGIVSLDEKD